MKPEGKNKTLIIILAVLLVIIISVAAFMFFYFFSKNQSDNGKLEKVGPIFETEEFTVNLGQSTSRFIKVDFALEFTNTKVMKELEEKLPLIKDAVIFVLSQQSVEALGTVEGKEELKKQLIENINVFLEKGEVKRIYFNNFIFT